jgi:hypothetical protein
MKARASRLPDLNILRELFTYDPESGEILWRVDRGPNKLCGTEAGYTNPSGYRLIKVTENKVTKAYMAARIAYALHFGCDPYPNDVDHINRDPGDNRINNLRAISPSDNNKNRRGWCSTNEQYVHRKGKKFVVQIHRVYYGVRHTLEEAITLRDEVLNTLQSVTTP